MFQLKYEKQPLTIYVVKTFEKKPYKCGMISFTFPENNLIKITNKSSMNKFLIFIQAYLKNQFSSDDILIVENLFFYISFLKNKPYFTIQNGDKTSIHLSKIVLSEIEAILRPLLNTHDCYEKVDRDEYQSLL